MSSSSSSSSSSTVLSTITSTASKATLYAAGLYLVRGYITERLDDVKEKLESERIARDILKRRFEQMQEDVGYTVMAMLPSLAEGMIEEMDVEGVPKELKGLGKEKAREKEREKQSSSNETSNEDSELSSSFASAGSAYSYTTSSIAASASASNLSVVLSSALSVRSGGDESDAGSQDSSKSKSALWLHLLQLTLTRTLLTSYTISLLSLFTTLQLTLLARAKYVCGIMQKAKEEEVRERIEENVRNEFSFGGILMKMIKGRLGLGSGSVDWGRPEELYSDGFGEVDDAEHSYFHANWQLGSKRLAAAVWQNLLPLPHTLNANGNKSGAGGLIHAAPDPAFEALSTRYLTLSYHFLHVGWRDLAETVREAVIATLADFYVHDDEKDREEKVTLKTSVPVLPKVCQAQK
ncbi:hypothetical protein K435DRAFT_873327 [Dendrothele bispora CBS 962.96]|uniref:Peroxin-3 n=1 Tax=Dendrothele bispora (strain CBS 962.96) TaxID=1314807 RepID=A0A4S8KZH1_DENBC|nr:hypothetical protein K435DRAFT_873327 [Dendrothele bispora CBS 962.96]